jgi:hypothetical protein
MKREQICGLLTVSYDTIISLLLQQICTAVAPDVVYLSVDKIAYEAIEMCFQYGGEYMVWHGINAD